MTSKKTKIPGIRKLPRHRSLKRVSSNKTQSVTDNVTPNTCNPLIEKINNLEITGDLNADSNKLSQLYGYVYDQLYDDHQDFYTFRYNDNHFKKQYLQYIALIYNIENFQKSSLEDQKEIQKNVEKLSKTIEKKPFKRKMNIRYIDTQKNYVLNFMDNLTLINDPLGIPLIVLSDIEHLLRVAINIVILALKVVITLLKAVANTLLGICRILINPSKTSHIILSVIRNIALDTKNIRKNKELDYFEKTQKNINHNIRLLKVLFYQTHTTMGKYIKTENKIKKRKYTRKLDSLKIKVRLLKIPRDFLKSKTFKESEKTEKIAYWKKNCIHKNPINNLVNEIDSLKTYINNMNLVEDTHAQKSENMLHQDESSKKTNSVFTPSTTAPKIKK